MGDEGTLGTKALGMKALGMKARVKLLDKLVPARRCSVG